MESQVSPTFEICCSSAIRSDRLGQQLLTLNVTLYDLISPFEDFMGAKVSKYAKYVSFCKVTKRCNRSRHHSIHEKIHDHYNFIA